jgi:hypothetical protein
MTIAESTKQQLELIKTVAITSGLRISEPVLAMLGGQDALTIHEYATTGGITLALPKGVLVNAPFDDEFCALSPLELVADGEELHLRLDSTTVPVVSVIPLPGYLAAVDSHGRPASDVVMSHADRIRLSPVVGCAYDCHFCDLASLRYEPRQTEQLLEAFDIARADQQLPPRHLLISGGTPGRAAKHQDYFREICLAVLRHIQLSEGTQAPSFDLDIMMSAREDGPDFVDAMVDAGVNGFSINIEVYSDEASRQVIPLKHKFARPHLEAMLVRAVERLGSTGRVRSLIIAGLEPQQETLAGIEWLASLGVDPVISPFRPARDTELSDATPPSPDAMLELLAEARDIAVRHGVALGPRCVPCQHNTLTFPWDTP